MATKSVDMYNKQGSIFVLLHKIDRIPIPQRKEVFEKKKAEINSHIFSDTVKVKEFFATSIYDETLYQAWSRIVQEMVPNR